MNDAELIRLKEIINQTFKGGEGSGNFNHAGRPGEVGGSAEQATGRRSRIDPEARARLERLAAGDENTENPFSKDKPFSFERGKLLNGEIEIGSKKFGETALLYDRNGNLVKRHDSSTEHGQDKSVSIAFVVPDGAILSHNHPSGDSFSIADIIAANRNSVGEMRVITGNKIFSMRSDKWPSPLELHDTLKVWDGIGGNNGFWSKYSNQLGIDYKVYER